MQEFGAWFGGKSWAKAVEQNDTNNQSNKYTNGNTNYEVNNENKNTKHKKEEDYSY